MEKENKKSLFILVSLVLIVISFIVVVSAVTPSQPTNITCDGEVCSNLQGKMNLECSGSNDGDGDVITYFLEFFDPPFQGFSSDWDSRSCTSLWGADCSAWASGCASEADNTHDDCSSCTGGSGDEHVNEVWVNATDVEVNSQVSINCTFDPYSTGTEEYIWVEYPNSTWVNLYSGSAPGADPHTLTTTFTPDVSGEYWVRCIADWDGSGSPCESGNYYDQDDVNFSVTNPSVGSWNSIGSHENGSSLLFDTAPYEKKSEYDLRCLARDLTGDNVSSNYFELNSNLSIVENNKSSVPTSITCNGFSCETIADNSKISCSGSVDLENDSINYFVEAYYKEVNVSYNTTLFYDGAENWGTGDCPTGSPWDFCDNTDGGTTTGDIAIDTTYFTNGTQSIRADDFDPGATLADPVLRKEFAGQSCSNLYVSFDWVGRRLDSGEYGLLKIHDSTGEHIIKAINKTNAGYNGWPGASDGGTWVSDTFELSSTYDIGSQFNLTWEFLMNGGGEAVLIDDFTVTCENLATYSWHDIGNHSAGGDFIWNSSNLPEQSGVDLRCSAIDSGSDNETDYYTGNFNANISHETLWLNSDGEVIDVNVTVLGNNKTQLDFGSNIIEPIVLNGFEGGGSVIFSEVPVGQQAFLIDFGGANFDNGSIPVTEAYGNNLAKCNNWDPIEGVCLSEFVTQQSIIPGEGYDIFVYPEDPVFMELTIGDCNAEAIAGSSGEWNAQCDNNTGSFLASDDGIYETHDYAKRKWAGVRIESYNDSVIDCAQIDSVDLCYERWTASSNIQRSRVKVSGDSGVSWVSVDSSIPGTTANPGITCTDVTSDYAWTCEHFFKNFTGQADRSQAYIEVKGSSVLTTSEVLTTDALYFNVNYSSDITPPSTVSNLGERISATTFIEWNWTNPADADFDYNIIYIDGVWVANVSENFYRAEGFSTGETHNITINTIDVNGNLNDTNVTDSAPTSSDVTPPLSITGLSSPSKTSASIYFSWTNPVDGDFLDNVIYLDGVEINNTNNNYYNFTGLFSSTNYTITVHTRDFNYNINNTDVNLTVETSFDGASPGSISNLKVLAKGGFWLLYNWSNPIDSDFNHSILYLDGQFLANVSGTQYKANGLYLNTSYRLDVQTVDRNGNINSNNVTIINSTSDKISIFFEGFEGGVLPNYWQVIGGTVPWGISTSMPYEGSFNAQQSNADGDAILMTSVNASEYESITVSFFGMTSNNLDAGEYFAFDYYNGTSWVELLNQQNIAAYTAYSYDLPSSMDKNNNLSFRFRCSPNGGAEYCYMDNFDVSGIDAINPIVNITMPVDEIYGNTNVVVNYEASDNLNLSRCFYSFNGALNVTVTDCSSFNLTGVENRNNLTVYAEDVASLIGNDSVSFDIDLTSPIVSINSPVVNYSDNGNPSLVSFNCSSSDNYELKNISLYVNGAFVNSSNVTGAINSSSWVNSFVPGEYNFSCLSSDSVGNFNWSEDRSFLIETLAPRAFNIGPNNTLKTDVVNQSFEVNMTEEESGLFSYTLFVYDSGGLYFNETFNGNNLSVNGFIGQKNLTDLADSVYTWNWKVYDAAGNVNVTDNWSIEIDTTSPATINSLGELFTGNNWIYWDWLNPDDLDFSKNIIYIDGVNVVNTSNNFYNATRLETNITYNISIQTVDDIGHVNTIFVWDIATTNYIVNNKPYFEEGGLINPANRIVLDYNSSIFLDWNNSIDLDLQNIVYDLYVDNESDFSSPEVYEIDLVDTNYTINSELLDGDYYWKVVPYDGFNFGNSSDVWYFSVDATGLQVLNSSFSPAVVNNDLDVVFSANILGNIDTVWYESNFSGVETNFTSGIVNSSNWFNVTISSGNFSNLENISFKFYVNDSFGNIEDGELLLFEISNRVPSVPGVEILNYSEINEEYLFLDWNDSIDLDFGNGCENGGCDIAYYFYGSMNESNVSSSLLYTGSNSEYNWTGFVEGDYFYYIVASDGVVNVSSSVDSFFVELACTPSLNEDWIIVDSQVCNNKTVSSGNGSIIVEYGGNLTLMNSSFVFAKEIMPDCSGDCIFIESGSEVILG